jgi:hypothetical protein
VSITVSEAQHLEDVHSAVHARNDCEVSLWGEGQSSIGKGTDEFGVVDK